MSNKPNQLVKYRNDVNKLSFRGFSSTDYDIFLSLCSVISNKKEQEITLSYDELESLIGTKKHLTTSDMTELIKHMGKRLLKLNFEVIEAESVILTPFFIKFKIVPKDETLTFQLSEWSIPLLNDLQMNFTLFELKDFVKITSKHSKTLFRMLKQFRTTGIWNVSIDDFSRIFDIPKSYNNNKIKQRVIDPSVKELQEFFKGLECTTVRNLHRQGRPVTGYSFTFQKQQPDRIEQKQKKAIEMKKEGVQPDKRKKSGSDIIHRKGGYGDFEQRDYGSETDLEALLGI